MQHKPVRDALQPHFQLDVRKLEFIARFLVALLKVRSVSLNQIAAALNGSALLESNAKRARRFLEFDLAQDLIARLVLSFLGDRKIVLCMDRTTWKFGCATINFLVIAVAHHGIALPIAWVNLEKDGNSDSSERKQLLERVLRLIPATRILGFAADREFIGEAWFKSLLEHAVNPVIRIRENTVIQHRARTAPAWAWFNTIKPGEVLELGKARVMCVRVLVVATLTAKGELLALVTVKRPARALAIYAQRLEIETLFGAFKTRGFNLEATRVTNPRRSERLFGLLVLALVWAVVGEFLTWLAPLRLKKHGFVARSVFGRGLDGLRRILLSGRSGKFVLDGAVLLLSGS
jgi:hypothetical protein